MTEYDFKVALEKADEKMAEILLKTGGVMYKGLKSLELKLDSGDKRMYDFTPENFPKAHANLFDIDELFEPPNKTTNKNTYSKKYNDKYN